MLSYRANGKLLLTSEYAITQGAKGLALPTRFGQKIQYKPKLNGDGISWSSARNDGKIWFWAEMSQSLDILKTSNEIVAKRLIRNLRIVKNHSTLLDRPASFVTDLEFPAEWGLGTSSTFTSLLAQCAQINPLKTFKNEHGGSGYDLACAAANGPITYQLLEEKPEVINTSIPFDFLDQLGFVYTGRKQLTSESLSLVKNKPFSDKQIDRFNMLTDNFLRSSSILELEKVIEEHEALLAEHLQLPKVKQELFEELPGQVKSLGGWGGDFVLITRLRSSEQWLKKKGFTVVFPFQQLGLFRS
jgi:mevalonate kinase